MFANIKMAHSVKEKFWMVVLLVHGTVTNIYHIMDNPPPPFKEKVSTYDVKLTGTEVWVNPLPYPEGTERPGAVIPLQPLPDRQAGFPEGEAFKSISINNLQTTKK